MLLNANMYLETKMKQLIFFSAKYLVSGTKSQTKFFIRDLVTGTKNKVLR